MHRMVSEQHFGDETAGFTPELFELRGWKPFEIAFPVIDVGFTAGGEIRVRIRMRCEQYNDDPASIELLNPQGQFLESVEADPAGVFNPGKHPSTGRPFICMRGSKEYHTHPSHIGDSWHGIRDSHSLGYVLTQVWRAWKRRNS